MISLFIGIDSEIEREEVWVETGVTHVAGMATFNKQQALFFAVHRILFSSVREISHIFLQILYRTVTVQVKQCI